MTQETLRDEYFDWMYDLVCDGSVSYRRLLKHLYSIDFTYTVPMDGNRFEDGVNLRYRFAYENDYDYSIASRYLDNKPCSVLEMMVALAHRCEEQIMDNPEFGDRTYYWFEAMLESLGLMSMTDFKYDQRRVDDVISRFLNRDYEPSGRGGLFTIDNCRRDMRSVDIWYQMCWFLDKHCKGEVYEN